MARDDYGAISVISAEEREALGLGGRGRKPDEEEGLFETIGKAGDKLGETQLGKKNCNFFYICLINKFEYRSDVIY